MTNKAIRDMQSLELPSGDTPHASAPIVEHGIPLEQPTKLCSTCRDLYSICMHCPGCGKTISRVTRMHFRCTLCRKCGATNCHECVEKCGKIFCCYSCGTEDKR